MFLFEQGRKRFIVIRHGMPFKREGSIKAGQSAVEFYRPEKHDVLVYDTEFDEIGVHADTKGERELYLSRLGWHLFGDEGYFPTNERFTLDPLRERGAGALECQDVPGLKSVRLVEYQRYWGGDFTEVETRRASNVFGALGERRHGYLDGGRLTRAVFEAAFEGEKKPRKVILRPPNIATCDRDSDSEVIERWLRLRGFIRETADGPNAPVDPPVVCAI